LGSASLHSFNGAAATVYQSSNLPISQSFGHVIEIFSGIQGEGIHVGRRQIFLRLAGCNLRCDYCDQPEARVIPATALMEQTPGRRDFMTLRNPLPAETVARAIAMLNQPPDLHHALAVTGGEPLTQAEFLTALLPAPRRAGLRILLETNGTRPAELRALRRLVDIVSMDFKLRSATGRPMPARLHARFLAEAVRWGMEVYVKAVVAAGTTPREVARVAAIISRVERSVPLVLQPATGGPFELPQGRPEHSRMGGRPQPPAPAQLLELQAVAAHVLSDVRVIPQTHKIIGQR
jgi:organic radical activating enzyme